MISAGWWIAIGRGDRRGRADDCQGPAAGTVERRCLSPRDSGATGSSGNRRYVGIVFQKIFRWDFFKVPRPCGLFRFLQRDKIRSRPGLRAEAHHYLSQAFLSGFVNDAGDIWMFDRRSGRLTPSAPKAIACKNDLYAFTGADGTTKRDTERELFGLIDRPIRPILQKLTNHQHVSDSELDQVAQFVGYLKVRTPSGIDELEQAYTGLLNKTHPYRSKPYVEAAIKRYESESGKASDLGADEIVAMFTSERYELAPERGHLLVLMCEMGLKIAEHVRSLDWTFLVSPQGRQFIVSDHPFVIVPPAGHDPLLGGVGIRSPGAVKYVPLDATLCLRMGDTGTAVTHHLSSGAEVRKINALIASNSERFVYGSNEALLRRIVSAPELRSGEHRSEVVIREISHATDPDRTLLQVFTQARIRAKAVTRVSAAALQSRTAP